MFAFGFSSPEFNEYLSCGWRRFGIFFFRPNCTDCYQCRPIRVKVNEYSPTRSQRRVINKNRNTKVIFKKLEFREELYDVYKEHSVDRFNQQTDINEFKETFFYNSVPALQSEYYVGEKLAALGFIDVSNEALSSVYFVYRTEYSELSLGTFGAIKEIEYAESLNLKYYYLGYYIQGNRRMSYKNKFKPHEIYDWKKGEWNDAVNRDWV